MNEVFYFLNWMRKNTQYVQSNVVFYKGKHYFLDRKESDSRDGGFKELYNEYKNE